MKSVCGCASRGTLSVSLAPPGRTASCAAMQKTGCESIMRRKTQFHFLIEVKYMNKIMLFKRTTTAGYRPRSTPRRTSSASAACPATGSRSLPKAAGLLRPKRRGGSAPARAPRRSKGAGAGQPCRRTCSGRARAVVWRRGRAPQGRRCRPAAGRPAARRLQPPCSRRGRGAMRRAPKW